MSSSKKKLWQKFKGMIKESKILLPAIIAFISVITTTLSPIGYDWDAVLIMTFILISIFVYLYAESSKYKWILKLLSIYIFINTIIFPLSYLLLLKSNPISFKVENQILNYEKGNSLSELNTNYNPQTLKKTISVVKEILEDTSKVLSQNISEINNGNIVFCGSYVISKDCASKVSTRPMYVGRINICNQKGENAAILIDKNEGCKLSYSDQSIRHYLSLKKNHLDNRLKDFVKERKTIEDDNNYWTYRQLLPYTISIFSTGNLTPISKIANLLFQAHKFFSNILMLTLLISLVQKEFGKIFDKEAKK